MFSTAVGHFVKAVGKDSFIPVPSLDVADNVKLLQLVVKKNRFWFWEKPKYMPTDFSLNDLLVEGGKLSLPDKSRTLVSNYNPTYNISVNGKFGAALCKELIHVEIDADDEINLKVDFGDVEKAEVDDIPKLLKALESVRLDLESNYVKQLRRNSYNTLCLVVGVARLTKESDLESELKLDNGGNISAAVASASAHLTVDDDKVKSFKIPSGTAIAYNVCELLISKSGEIQLVVVEGSHGGFGGEDVADCPRSPSMVATDESSVKLFKGFLAMKDDERKNFTENILDIISTPRLVGPILLQLKAAYQSINKVRNSRCEVTLTYLKKSVVSKKNTWQSVLQTAGFTFQDDGRVCYPAEANDRLESCLGLFKALFELEDNEIEALRNCEPNLVKPLHNLLHDAILKYPLRKDSERYQPIFNDQNSALLFLKELDFNVEGEFAEPPQENSYSIQAAQRAVFALWGHAQM